jgi:hypothetical protein
MQSQNSELQASAHMYVHMYTAIFLSVTFSIMGSDDMDISQTNANSKRRNGLCNQEHFFPKPFQFAIYYKIATVFLTL